MGLMKMQKADWEVFKLLEKEPLTNKRIMKELGKSQPNVSKCLGKLRDRNMIGFQRCPDRRLKLYVALSESVHIKEG